MHCKTMPNKIPVNTAKGLFSTVDLGECNGKGSFLPVKELEEVSYWDDDSWAGDNSENCAGNVDL